MKNLLYLCLLLASCTPQIPQTRESISLGGEWKFNMDPMDVGISEQWYNKMLEQDVILPGSMTENGMGDEVNLNTPWTGGIVDQSFFTEERYEKYRQADNFKIPFWLKPEKYYKGPAWYQKEVLVPETWEDKQVILSLERAHWESRVFINGQEAGTRNSLAVAHEYDLSPLLKAGSNQLSIRIDNRMIVPVGINSHSVSDHTQSNWNGIVGQLFLEAGPLVSIKNIQIFPDIHTQTARAVISLENHLGEVFEGSLSITASSFNTARTHRASGFNKKVIITGTEHSLELEYPMGDEMQLWSEFSPALYNMDIELRDPRGRLIDRQIEVFGMREFKAIGTRFEVNNHPIFLRGTLECCIFPLTGYPPMDEASWEHIMNRIKEHGLNHIRFHSWCPPEAAFMVADKLGLYLQVECGSWANQGSTIGDGSLLDTFIYDESERIIEAYGNHPSFCMMAYGNEPAGAHMHQYLVEFMDYWRSRDQRRVYTAGAGWPLLAENDYHNGPQPRIQQWGEGLSSIINGTAPRTSFDFQEIISAYDIPFVSHEIGQWCVYPDFKEIHKYTGVLKPTNFEIFQETLEENHMGDQAEDFLMASGKLQALCYKAEIEAALRTPGFAGFQLLQLHDFPGQGTALVGVLDPFFNSKGYISPDEFRRFCNITVPLARMDQRTYTTQETFRAEIEMAHFGKDPLKDCRIICQIRDTSGMLLNEQVLKSALVPVDNAIQLGSIEYALNDMSAPAKLTLEVTVEGSPYSNSWDFWIYPGQSTPDPGLVHICDKLDQEANDILSGGGSVLLLVEGKVNEKHGAEVKIGFSSIFWNTAWTGGQAPHTLGILCEPAHKVFSSFPTEYHSNWQWWDPVTHSQAMILDDFPAEFRPLIQPIDTWFENRRLGLLFEARTGQGKLMVCSINLQEELDERPVSRQLLHSILHYMNSSDFKPETEIELELIRDLT